MLRLLGQTPIVLRFVVALMTVAWLQGCAPAEKRGEATASGVHGTCSACEVISTSTSPLLVRVAAGSTGHDEAIDAMRALFESKGFRVEVNTDAKPNQHPLRRDVKLYPDLILYESGGSDAVAIVEVETERLAGQLEQWKRYAGQGVPLHIAVPAGTPATRSSYLIREHGLDARVWTYSIVP